MSGTPDRNMSRSSLAKWPWIVLTINAGALSPLTKVNSFQPRIWWPCSEAYFKRKSGPYNNKGIRVWKHFSLILMKNRGPGTFAPGTGSRSIFRHRRIR
jgi:hypothetical protein